MEYNLGTVEKTPGVVPNYSFAFNFEDEFVFDDGVQWMVNNWTNTFYFSGLYVIFIFAGQRYMKNRPAYKLRGLLSVWNTLLALFSIMGVCRTAPELFHVLKYQGFYHSVCVSSFITDDRVSSFWSFLFTLSKLPELGDTVFIVLRKQPLMLLHWYHHTTVLIYSWFSFSEYVSTARWFVVMNYSVHSLMYSYYALRAMGCSPPRFIAMAITECQLLQMFVGCAINLHAINMKKNQIECHVSWTNITASLVIYFTYFLLFTRFFYKAYFSSNRKKFSVNANKNDFRKLTQYGDRADGKFKSN